MLGELLLLPVRVVNALTSTRVSAPRIGTSFGMATAGPYGGDSFEAAFLEKHYVYKPQTYCTSQ